MQHGVHLLQFQVLSRSESKALCTYCANVKFAGSLTIAVPSLVTFRFMSMARHTRTIG